VPWNPSTSVVGSIRASFFGGLPCKGCVNPATKHMAHRGSMRSRSCLPGRPAPEGRPTSELRPPLGARPHLHAGPSKTRVWVGGELDCAPQTGVFAGSDHRRTRNLGATMQKWAQRQASWRVAPGAGGRSRRQGPAAGAGARPHLHAGPSQTRVRMGRGQRGPEPSEAYRGGRIVHETCRRALSISVYLRHQRQKSCPESRTSAPWACISIRPYARSNILSAT
jgi:hypothetical protein